MNFNGYIKRYLNDDLINNSLDHEIPISNILKCLKKKLNIDNETLIENFIAKNLMTHSFLSLLVSATYSNDEQILLAHLKHKPSFLLSSYSLFNLINPQRTISDASLITSFYKILAKGIDFKYYYYPSCLSMKYAKEIISLYVKHMQNVNISRIGIGSLRNFLCEIPCSTSNYINKLMLNAKFVVLHIFAQNKIDYIDVEPFIKDYEHFTIKLIKDTVIDDILHINGNDKVLRLLSKYEDINKLKARYHLYKL